MCFPQAEAEASSSDEDSDGELVHETTCAMCQADGQLINCASCVSAFHMDCHDPPLHREPR